MTEKKKHYELHNLKKEYDNYTLETSLDKNQIFFTLREKDALVCESVIRCETIEIAKVIYNDLDFDMLDTIYMSMTGEKI